MRDRLVELLKNARIIHTLCNSDGKPIKSFATKAIEEGAELQLADHLLANGVIVPPCKVGDTVYYINIYNHIMLYRDRVYEAVVSRIVVTKYDVSYVIRIHGGHAVNEIPNVEFWKTVFLTREEAEQALKGENHGQT